MARYNLAREEKRALLAGRFALCGRDGTIFSERIISAGGFRPCECPDLMDASSGRLARSAGILDRNRHPFVRKRAMRAVGPGDHWCRFAAIDACLRPAGTARPRCDPQSAGMMHTALVSVDRLG